MIVYLATNTINGKQYVGQTSHTLEQRWKEHIKWSRYCSDRLGVVHKAIIKYGAQSFSLEVLHTCETKEEMDFVEMFYISLLNAKVPNGYNLTEGGEGGLGYHHTDGAKKAMSISKTGKPLNLSAEQRAAMGKRSSERVRTPEWNKKVGDAHRGKTISEETRTKIKKARAKQVIKPRSDETKRRMSIAISAAKPWKHGTKTGRVNHKCTCSLCIVWAKENWKRRKARQNGER
jgi:group I intron endonuclease